ncbi:MAG: zinc-ribbon domain-containing protein [Solirubrobacterales bacterium]
MNTIDPKHEQTRKVLRCVGIPLLIIGVILFIIGTVSFFRSFGGMEPPRYFWCAFLGMPVTFVGGVLTSYGFMGSVMRYSAQEMAPAGKDTFNYLAEETKDSVKTLASAVGEGLRAGSPAATAAAQVRCHKCNRVNPADAKFCSGCGAPLGKTKACPTCNELNDPDAKFCDNCGRPMGQ